MATLLTPEKVNIYVEDLDVNSPNSEGIQTKIAKAALFGQDITEYLASFEFGGYFRSATVFNGAQRFVVTKRSQINRYILSLGDSGSTAVNSINVAIYDDAGAYVNDLFSSSNEPSLSSPSNRSNSFVGKDVVAVANLDGNIAGATVNYGTLNLTILEEGYQLAAFVVSNAESALNANLTLTLQRLE